MKAQIVSFHCVLKDKLGQVLSSSFNQDVINQLESGQASGNDSRLRGLVAGIQNVRPGERRQFTVPAREAYGPYDPDLVLKVSRSDLLLGDRLVVGSEIVSQPDRDGVQQTYRVVEVHPTRSGDILVLDANHPLAGHDLVFDIEVVSARDACSEDFEEPDYTAPVHYVH